MELSGRRMNTLTLKVWLRRLVSSAFILLGVLLVLIFGHATAPEDGLLLPVEVLAIGVLAFTLASFLAGIAYWWTAFPRHRRAVLFLVAITATTLLAHAYIIGNPPASDPRTSLSGLAGTQLQSSDHQVTVTSTVLGQLMTVTVTASGNPNAQGKAIVYPQLDSPAQVTGGGFGHEPSYRSPLEPGDSVRGTWTVSGQVSDISVSYQELNCYKTSSPAEYGCIMDEIFYVPEGMGILVGQHCSIRGPTDCHLEHPPLVPALLAAGMAVFGEYNVVGWRVMPALLGTFSIPLLFGIVWGVSESKRMAYLSATLLALDVMFFSQSSAGLLDAPEVFFGLAAFFVYFAKLRVWRLDRHLLAGVFLGLAGLAKETAIFIALAFATYVLLFGEEKRSARVFSVVKVAAVIGLVFVGGLQAYDSVLATPSVPFFTQQIGYILSYGSSLTSGCPWACGWTDSATGGYITPFNWFTYYSPVPYLKVDVFTQTLRFVGVAYYGVTNLLETWTTFVWVPLVAYTLVTWYRRREPSLEEFGFEGGGAAGARVPPETRFAGLSLILLAWGYLPYVFLFLSARVTYPFYVIPAIPAVAMGGSYWISRSWFPRWLMWLYLAMVFLFFLVYFPDKGFLPVWLRSLIGH